MALDIQTIEKRRKAMNVRLEPLCIQAGVTSQTYRNAMRGIYDPRADTISRLAQALSRFKMSFADEPVELAICAAYKTALVLAVAELKAAGGDKVSPRAVIYSDPTRKATGSPEWLAGARVRRLAFWICTHQLGLRPVDVAKAAGVTRQAVSQSKKELDIVVEADRQSPEARAMRSVEEVFG